MPKSKSEEWQELCKEWEVVWGELTEAQGELTRAFRGNGAPSEEQMDRADAAQRAVEDVKSRMDSLIQG